MVSVYEFKDGKSFYKGRPIFSIDEELSKGMLTRLDEIDTITFEYLEKLSGKKLDRADPNMTEIIGNVIEVAARNMDDHGHTICYPYTATVNEDTRCNLLCIHHPDCQLLKDDKCPHKEDIYTYDVEEYEEE